VFGSRFHGATLLKIELRITARFVKEDATIVRSDIERDPLTGQKIRFHDQSVS
jgi:hypothetical protein